MTLPRINLHDGKHKLIVAEDGERVLTPEQNEKYEASHPNARKEPMKANVYDFGGGISMPSMPSNLPLSKAPDVPLPTATGPDASGTAKPGTVQGQGDVGGKHVPIRGQVSTHTSSDDPLLDASHPESKLGWAYDKGGDIIGGTNENVYDKGGNVQTPLGNRIADRAQEIYAQAKDGGQNIMDPQDPGSAARRRETNAVLNSVSPRNEGDPAAPYEPSAMDRVHPLGQAYGSRPGEKRIYTDPEGNVVNPTTPQGLGAVGPKAPVPTALGKLPTYDDGGTVQTEEAPGQALLDDE